MFSDRVRGLLRLSSSALYTCSMLVLCREDAEAMEIVCWEVERNKGSPRQS